MHASTPFEALRHVRPPWHVPPRLLALSLAVAAGPRVTAQRRTAITATNHPWPTALGAPPPHRQERPDAAGASVLRPRPYW
ncbi:hypothetical protein XAXN_16570 [Xanthomonas axonopodis]|uniref:Uncharacterized protein n=1 Tax=Xanthomonas axonopodis TaxID=53413 RepID=A0A0P6W1Q7_9XANT|nr:hypothetical protein XAXN_16570 [Xanthomonas axonopodis]